MSQPLIPQTKISMALVPFSLLVGLSVRLYWAVTDAGVYWPDEIYQSFEPAHRLVYGYGLVPWEYIDGARNWALPGLVAGLLQLARVLGGNTPDIYVPFVKSAFVLLSMLTAWGAFHLARVYKVSTTNAALASLLFSLTAVPVYFGYRAMSEVASACPAIWGVVWVVDAESSTRRRILGASLLGLAVFFRLQMGLICVGALGILLGRRQYRELFHVLATLAVWAFLHGLFDKLTWGEWFLSAQKYVQFNLIEGKASQWGTAKGNYYLKHLLSGLGPVTWLWLALLSAAFNKARGLWLLAVSFFVAHSLIPHKELRFIYPFLPFAAALAAIGLAQLPLVPRRVSQVGMVLLSLFSLWHFTQLTFKDIGAYSERGNESAHDDFGDVNRLLLQASKQTDLCGLRVDVAPLAWTGGHTYLHRRAPLYHLGHPPSSTRLFNYLVTRDVPPGGEVIATEPKRNMKLVRLFATCEQDAGYSWRLP